MHVPRGKAVEDALSRTIYVCSLFVGGFCDAPIDPMGTTSLGKGCTTFRAADSNGGYSEGCLLHSAWGADPHECERTSNRQSGHLTAASERPEPSAAPFPYIFSSRPPASCQISLLVSGGSSVASVLVTSSISAALPSCLLASPLVLLSEALANQVLCLAPGGSPPFCGVAQCSDREVALAEFLRHGVHRSHRFLW